MNRMENPRSPEPQGSPTPSGVREDVRRAEEYSEMFKVLEEEGVIGKELATKLEDMARFRNLLVHRYGEVDNILASLIRNYSRVSQRFLMRLTLSNHKQRNERSIKESTA
ncbi:MAG: DUF86 domain-containing protein [Candidatus Bathyarchaeia archaeon]